MDLLDFKELDFIKTKRNVLKLVKKYEKALTRLDANDRPKITQTFQLVPSFGNGFHSSTEDTAIYVLEGRKEDNDFICRVENVLNGLQLEYRQIIWLTYFENKSNLEVAEELNIGQSQLSIKKRTAVELFAYGLGIDVYKI